MLVDNKFLYLSLPRCASTSFYISCLRNNLETIFFNQKIYDKYSDKIDLNLNNEELADFIIHSHEMIVDLLYKFGDSYDIISVKRDRYDRFISLWKHLIDLSNMKCGNGLSEKLKKLSLNDIFFYKTDDLVSNNSQMNLIKEFAERNGINEYMDDYMTNLLSIVIRPTSFWHNHNPKIKWFEFGDFRELEEWVSNKTGKPFKMEKSNGSQHFECNLKFNEEFIERYNNIYDYYDLPKLNKTLI